MMMVEKMKMLWKDEEGASAVEYGVLVAGIIAVCVAVIFAIGPKLDAAFDKVDEQLPAAPAG